MQHAGFSCLGKLAIWAFGDAGECDYIIVDRPAVRPPPCSQPSALSDNVRLSPRRNGLAHPSSDSPALASGSLRRGIERMSGTKKARAPSWACGGPRVNP